MKDFIEHLLSFSQSDYQSGVVVTDESTCTGCKQCTMVCPASALEMNERGKSQMKEGRDCISCGNCTAVCHTQSITVETFYQVPDGAYATGGRLQDSDQQSFPRFFTETQTTIIKPHKKGKK